MISLKEARLQAGLTQQKLSELLGISKRSIENWESGRTSPPEYVSRFIVSSLKKYKVFIGKEITFQERWLEENEYIPQDFVPGEHWILAMSYGGEVSYFETADSTMSGVSKYDPDTRPDDELVCTVRILSRFPTVKVVVEEIYKVV